MNQAARKRSVTILLVDDNSADIRLTVEALRDLKAPVVLEVARDGDQAIRLLRERAAESEASVPDLILLDLNLPRRNGREVLAEIKTEPTLRRIPVVILTTSLAERDLARCYDLHANCYVIKPLDFDRYIDAIRSIESFWLSTVLLPTRR
jgi:CheY-like chemotaxis protein